MKKAPKIILRTFGGIVAFVLLCFLVLQLVLTPKVATRLVNRISTEFIDGNLEFGEVNISVFKHFPNLSLVLEDVSLTYPHERFDSLESSSRLMKRGRGELADTLASFDRFVVAVSLPELTSGTVNVPVLSLSHPRVFAKNYNDSTCNWNIFKAGEQDSEDSASVSSSPVPAVRIHRVRIADNANIVYCSPEDSLSASLRLRRFSFRGNISSDDPASSEGRLRLDTLSVIARSASNSASLRLNNFRLAGNRDSLQIGARATASARTSLYGRIRVPVELDALLSIPQDSIPVAELRSLVLKAGGIPLSASGNVCLPPDGAPQFNLKARIDSCDVDDLIDRYAVKFLPQASEYKAGIMLDLDLSAGTRPEGQTDISLRNLSIDSDFLTLKASGNVKDALGKDPSVAMDASLHTAVDSLMRFIPDSPGLLAGGNLDASIKTSLRLSQLSMSQIANADIKASVTSDLLKVSMPADSISAYAKGFSVKAETNGARGGRILEKDERILGVMLQADSLNASLGGMYARAKDFKAAVMNSADILDAASTDAVHPLFGTVSANSLILKDASSLYVRVMDNRENFSIKPYKGDRSIPDISVNSKTSMAMVRMPEGRFNIQSLSLDFSAANVKYGKDRASGAGRGGRRSPSGRQRPEWLSDESLRSSDISFSLSDELAGYFKEWTLNGSAFMSSARILTPYFPLQTTVKGLNASFDNNNVNLKNFNLKAGKSNLHVDASVAGLRNMLLGRGFLKVNTNISSSSLDANELVAAYQRGSQFVMPQGVDVGDVSSGDELYQKMIEESAQSVNPDSVSLIVVPANINAEISLEAKNAKYSSFVIDSLRLKAVAKERCLQISGFNAFSPLGNIGLDAFYSTTTRQNVKTGFSLRLDDITAENVISLIPAVDEALPVLKNFTGLLNCSLAATASLDEHMNIKVPTMDGVLRISGKNLSIKDSEEFTKIAKLLMFKNHDKAVIDNLSVEGLVKDSRVEVFPFLVDVDRYDLALAGVQDVSNNDFYYHVSILNSPLPLKFGVDLRGGKDKKSKIGVCKVKYKDVSSVPVFSEVVEQSSINLLESIRNIFQKGVDKAVDENRSQKEISEFRGRNNYQRADLVKSESLDDETQSRLNELSEQ